MSYFEVGVYNALNQVNIGTLWRSAYQLGAAGIFTIGRPYHRQPSDTSQAMRQIPMRHFLTFEDFIAARPVGAVLVGIEMGGIRLSEFRHPLRAVYLLGGEDNGLPERILARCNAVVSLEAVNRPSFNLAVTGSIVLYHRVFLGGLGSRD
jgi:tRNA G18 (ribose-2'-O)-methylase SpoU